MLNKHFLQRTTKKATHIFIALDTHFAHKNKEAILAFCLPILLSVFVCFMWIFPLADSRLENATFALQQQENLANELAKISTQNIDITTNKKMLDSLQEKSLNNEALGYLLKPFRFEKLSNHANNPKNTSANPAPQTQPQRTKSQNLPPQNLTQNNLFFSTTGDSEALEDVLEILETNPFIFIQNLSINAPFASALEMRVEAINFGEIFDRIALNE
ncbi:hypothetical protein [Helicobacter sp. T3_23-1059]